MKTISLFRLLIACLPVVCILFGKSYGVPGDMGDMKSACASSDTSLRKLCDMVMTEFKEQQESYIHLGADLYLVTVPNIGRVREGVYTVSISAGIFKMFGGYGATQLGQMYKLSQGSFALRYSQSDLSHGKYSEGNEIIVLRNNPVTKRPYLISGRYGLLAQNVEVKVKNVPRYDSAKTLLSAHKKALAIYKQKNNEYEPIQIMKKAGIECIIDLQPEDLSPGQYVNLLNDYAFFIYKYGDGSTDLAIEILNKVIILSPGRTPAYLNMSDALNYLAEYQSSVPLNSEEIEQVKELASQYLLQYKKLKNEKLPDLK